MELNDKTLESMPEILNLDMLRTLLKMSKLTARYYLQSGLLKNTNSGKKTRNYTIKKEDVLKFAESYRQNPYLFVVPSVWYRRRGHINAALLARDDRMDEADITKSEKLWYYEQKLISSPDLFDIGGIAELTGYARETVARWIRTGELRCLTSGTKCYVPKQFLIEFLASPAYGTVKTKSTENLIDIAKMKYEKEHK